MKILPILLLTALLCSCAAKPPVPPPEIQGNSTLWDLKIRHNKQLLFSGLLTTEEKNRYLQIAVLDSSGITVMTGRLDQEGELEVFRCLAPARENNLPDFLGKSLGRIFYQDFGRNCVSDKKTVTCRSGFWPLSLWTVRYFSNNEDRVTEIVLHKPGVDLILEKIKSKEQNITIQ